MQIVILKQFFNAWTNTSQTYTVQLNQQEIHTISHIWIKRNIQRLIKTGLAWKC